MNEITDSLAKSRSAMTKGIFISFFRSLALCLFAATFIYLGKPQTAYAVGNTPLDNELTAALTRYGFTGTIETKFKQQLGRPIDANRANVGRLLWFDIIGGLNNDNTCGGCHSPTNGMGDSQPMAIGIDNNFIVGPNRQGPRNQRRTPTVINTALYPALMWNSRFFALSGNPFDNSVGFQFPDPEGRSLSNQPHLLAAQAFIPPTERTEAAGFAFQGDNTDIRSEVISRLNGISEYVRLFSLAFPEVAAGDPIDYDHFAKAIAEFEFTLVYANAPIDRYARGDANALTAKQKRGGLLFFGKAGCVQCHKVSGQSNEMFSDFQQHVIGVPQVVPSNGNFPFDGPAANQDFGLEQVTLNDNDRYMFRTAPLRNIAVSRAFMHNGAFVTLESAIQHHLNPYTSARGYTPSALPVDMRGPLGPIEPVLARLDPLLQTPTNLTATEFTDLVDFVRFGLLDPRALRTNLRALIPAQVPSGSRKLTFQ